MHDIIYKTIKHNILKHTILKLLIPIIIFWSILPITLYAQGGLAGIFINRTEAFQYNPEYDLYIHLNKHWIIHQGVDMYSYDWAWKNRADQYYGNAIYTYKNWNFYNGYQFTLYRINQQINAYTPNYQFWTSVAYNWQVDNKSSFFFKFRPIFVVDGQTGNLPPFFLSLYTDYNIVYTYQINHKWSISLWEEYDNSTSLNNGKPVKGTSPPYPANTNFLYNNLLLYASYNASNDIQVSFGIFLLNVNGVIPRIGPYIQCSHNLYPKKRIHYLDLFLQ